jgi:hypothetical protein
MGKHRLAEVERNNALPPLLREDSMDISNGIAIAIL